MIQKNLKHISLSKKLPFLKIVQWNTICDENKYNELRKFSSLYKEKAKIFSLLSISSSKNIFQNFQNI